MIQFERDTCCNLAAATRHEWLETNGLGGFASSTIIGLNTRRYHGLLVAATKPPLGRMVLLSKLEETLLIDGIEFDLAANRYPGVVYPQGFQYLKRFALDPFPVMSYEVEGIEIRKSICMIYGENSTVVQYELRTQAGKPPRSLQLEIRPLIAFRDYHSLTHENGALDASVQQQPGLAKITPYTGLPTLNVAHDALEVKDGCGWRRNFEYDAERERGLDFTEDLFNPLLLRFDLNTRPTAAIIASLDPRDVSGAREYQDRERTRRMAVLKASPSKEPFAQSLANAADSYIVSRGDQKTVIAGYHWFGDWGRDTMVALPGLTLVTGKHDIARSILRTFAQHVDQGILPNRFPDAGEAPEYNAVDASLWFFEAARAFLAYSGDFDFARHELYPAFVDIISWRVRGTRYGIEMDDSGLLNSGAPGVALTWMDAKIGDRAVTPRSGKPVEIQALWYNSLRIMEDLALRFEDEAGKKLYAGMAETAMSSFNRLFWNEKDACLFDVIDGDARDSSMRPNQIFAVSLPHGMLSPQRSRSVVERIQQHLLTPFGLRTLAADDPQYRGRYTGGPAERDGAYHQGTVWPWLLGPFITAYVKVNRGSDAAKRQAAIWLEPLRAHLSDTGMGQIPELFEGDPPHRPCGCIAQAWSVAEINRVLVEDLGGITAVWK